jgi:hypothetical protein
MKKSFVRGLWILLAVGLVSVGAWAQASQTGSLTGLVFDDQNQPLPGVSVVITSPALITPKLSTVTSAQGFFRFTYLPPGRYKAEVTLPGFSPYVQEEIVVRVGDTTEIRVILSQAKIEETIRVVAAAPAVSLANTKSSIAVSREDLAHLPVARDLSSILMLAPGVTKSSSALGGAVRGNSFNVDGVFMNDPRNSTNAANASLDIYDEVQVSTTGHPAEYGYASGAVLNVITKSGGNKLSGDLSFYYYNKSFMADNWTSKGLAAAPTQVQSKYEANATLGGPIIKDKLWFFAAFSLAPTVSNVDGFPVENIKNQLISPMLRLTAQPAAAHRLSLIMTYSRITNPYSGASYNASKESTFDSTMNRFIGVANWLWTMSPTSILEVRGAVYSNPMTLNSNGGNTPLVWNIPDNTITGGFPSTEAEVNRYLGSANVTRYLDNVVGDHMFKAGVEFELSKVRNRSVYPVDEWGMSNYTILVPGVAEYAFKYIPTEDEGRLSDYTQLSGYLQDSWRISRGVHLNAGLRISYMKLGIPVQTNVNERIPIASWTDFEPRLGLAVDPFGDGKTSFKLGFNRYTSAMYVWYDSFNPNSASIEYYMRTAPGTFMGPIFTQTPSVMNFLANDLKRPYVYEYSAGVSRNLGSGWKGELMFIAKRYRGFVTSELDNAMLAYYTQTSVANPLGGTLTIYDQLPTWPSSYSGYYDNNSYAYRDYDAVMVDVEKKFGNGSFLRANYTWSRAYGTANQDFDEVGASAQSAGFNWWNDPNVKATGYTAGLLDQDRTHQIKVQGIAMLPAGFILGVNYFGTSGTPYTRSFYFRLTKLGVTRFLAEERGSQRFPFTHYLDVRIEKGFQVMGKTLSLFADIFNPLNFNETLNQAVILGTADYGKVTAIQDPRFVQLGFRFSY